MNEQEAKKFDIWFQREASLSPWLPRPNKRNDNEARRGVISLLRIAWANGAHSAIKTQTEMQEALDEEIAWANDEDQPIRFVKKHPVDLSELDWI